MRKLSVVLAMTLLGYLAIATGWSVADEPILDPEAETIWANYINHDCEVGEEGEALAAVLERSTLFESRLVRVLRDGLEEVDIDLARAGAEKRWQVLERYLQSRVTIGLSLSDETRLRSLKKVAFVEMETAALARVQRENAAIALAAIGSPASMQVLREVALTDESLRSVIMDAVEAQQRKALN